MPFFSMSGSEFMEIFVGVGAASVRDLFEQAKKRAPCIIFIDELDAIGKSRAAGRGIFFSNDEREQTLNQLLAEMDGFDTSSGVIIVEMYDIDEAIDRVMLGLEKKNRVMSAAEKERVAHHEAGHALVALSVEHAAPVHLVSIIPRSVGALGHTLQLPTEERFLMTRSELRDQLTVMLGGRAAEEITFHGEISTGAADDLDRAAELARQMVTRFGMSERLGNLTYGKRVTGRFLESPFMPQERNYSDRTAEVIDDKVHRLISEAYDSSQSILLTRHQELERIAQELIQKETLDRATLGDLIRESSRLA